MPTFVYQDSENVVNELIPAGVYGFKVLRSDQGFVESGPNSGKEMFEMRIAIYDDQGDQLTQIKERLVFTDNAQWRVETFLKCANWVPPKLQKGQNVTVNAEDCVGLKGYCKVGVRTYQKSTGKRDQNTGEFLTEPAQINEVKTWLTDAKKLPRDTTMIPRTKPAQPPAQAPASPSVQGDDCPF